MRILHMITRMILGGAQENTLLSVLGQQARPGYEVALLTGPTAGPEGNIVPLARAQGMRIEEEPLLTRPVRPLQDWGAYRSLRRRVRRMRPDVVHTHSSKAGIRGRWAAWAEGVPFVVHTIHGLPFHPYQGWLANRMYVAAERLAARRCHAIVSVADAMTAQALAAGVGSPAQYTTVYSGMETEPFLRRDRDMRALRARWGLGEGDFVIGKVARLFELKGHEYLFEAFARVVKRHPASRLFLIGDGIRRERYERLARAGGFGGRVTFAGLVPREEIPEAIAVMDMVAHCSLREGLARVLPQALLSEKPVASFDVDGAREVVLPGRTGFLLPPRDASALESAIESVIREPEKARAMAREGCRLCRERFDWRRMVDSLCALYERGLASAGLQGGRASAEMS
ncbi:MAG: glycosyltransferase family 4 protein [Planctomycetota bacterium]